jgi:hypothetical protein
MIVPEQLPIAAAFASAFQVEGEVTARDLSYALMFMREAAELGESGEVMLHDNATRHALALSRRDRVEVEEARWSRLRSCTINSMPAPVIRYATRPDGTEYPWRHKAGDLRPIVINEDLLEAYVGDGDDVVFFPLRLLQHAESRFSIILMMRVLAWAQGDYPKKALVRRNGASLTLKFGMAEWSAITGAPALNQRLVDEYLMRAATEISDLTDWQVTIRPRVAYTGRIRDKEIMIVDPVNDPADDDRAIEAKSVAWRPASRPSRKQKKITARVPSATPVAVSRTALDAAVPLSRLSPDRQ